MSHIDESSEQHGINLLQFVAGREEQTDEATIFVCARGRSFGRTALKWDKGDLCYVELEGTQYPGKVLDWAFSPDGNYLQTTVEYYVSYKDWSGTTRYKTVIWPKPIQSYKLKRRVS